MKAVECFVDLITVWVDINGMEFSLYKCSCKPTSFAAIYFPFM